MTEDPNSLLCVAALLTASLLGAWTAWACRRAQQRGSPGSEALVWASLSAVFLLYSLAKLVWHLGWLEGTGGWLRTLASQNGLYADRRSIQILATIAVALIVIVLVLYGLFWMWDSIKRCRLAIGLASLTVGLGVIRIISLHEVDAWNAAMPWASAVVELCAAAGVSAVAISRLGVLGSFARLPVRSKLEPE